MTKRSLGHLKLLRVALATVALCCIQAAMPSIASATSTFDNYVVTTEKLELWSDQTNYPCSPANYQHDWTMDWESLITDPQYWSFGNQLQHQSSYEAAFNDSLDGGGWMALNYFNDASDKNKGVILRVAYSPSGLKANWSSAGVSFSSQSNADLYVIDFQVFQNGSCSPKAWTPSRDGSTWFGYGGNTSFKILLAGGSVNINKPSGYEGPEIPLSTPPTRFVAMGDSFSSGEGNSPYEAGTDTSSNKCHRSPIAYPRLLNEGTTSFVACSSATTSDVLYGSPAEGNWDEGPQIDVLSVSTEKVTITIGGNDVGFKEYVEGCTASCGPGSTSYSTINSNINSASFLNNLESTYKTILEKATSANLYVVDYPYMTAANAGTCGVFDFSGGRSIQISLNSTIALAVSNVRSESPDYRSRLKYVNVNGSGSPFDGKHLCNGGVSDFGSTTLHPNADGHQDYKDVINSSL